jgi:hypothetical protein
LATRKYDALTDKLSTAHVSYFRRRLHAMATVRADDARTSKRLIVRLFIFFKEEKEGKVKLSLGQGKKKER